MATGQLCDSDLTFSSGRIGADSQDSHVQMISNLGSEDIEVALQQDNKINKSTVGRPSYLQWNLEAWNIKILRAPRQEWNTGDVLSVEQDSAQAESEMLRGRTKIVMVKPGIQLHQLGGQNLGYSIMDGVEESFLQTEGHLQPHRDPGEDGSGESPQHSNIWGRGSDHSTPLQFVPLPYVDLKWDSKLRTKI